MYSFDGDFLIFDRYYTRLEVLSKDWSVESEDFVQYLWHSSLSFEQKSFILYITKLYKVYFSLFNFIFWSFFTIFIECGMVQLFFFCLQNFSIPKETRQTSPNNSQQLNIIICKSRNKYETNWHETTVPHTYRKIC